MDHWTPSNQPKQFAPLLSASYKHGFTMQSDEHIGALLRTLVSTKVNGRFLELGTGFGLSLSWMADGLQGNAQLISIDNDSELIKIAGEYFGNDPRIQLVCTDGSNWIQTYKGELFDLIFADAWPGKYSEIDETLALLNPGGFYVIDDMLPQENWPPGHQEKANSLMSYLKNRKDLHLTNIKWSTGIVIATKISNHM